MIAAPGLTHTELPNGEDRWASSRGELRLRWPAPGVVVFVEKGFLSAAFVPFILHGASVALSQAQRITLFVDGYDLEGYDPEIRNAGTSVLKDNASRVIVQHMLMRSRLAKMGLSVVSLILGAVIEGHTERAPFDAALGKAIRDSRLGVPEPRARP